jgi:hypothetical protein
MINSKRDSALLYAEGRLSCWARWARDNRDSLGFPTTSLLYKAMRQKSERIKALNHGRITARGTETVSFTPNYVPEAPEAIAETDRIVAQLPRDLNVVIIADYFTYGPIEVRAGATPWRRARYCQLLEAAKYAVYVSLDARG